MECKIPLKKELVLEIGANNYFSITISVISNLVILVEQIDEEFYQ